jgi:hypothetical protein
VRGLGSETSPTMTKRLTAAAAGFIGGGLLSMILFAFVVSIFDLGFQTVMPGALLVAVICGIAGFCFPKIGAILPEFVD